MPEEPLTYERGRLMIARTEGHLRINDDLQRDVGTRSMEGCSDKASTFTEDYRLEVVLLPLLIPIDVGQFLQLCLVGEARDREVRQKLVSSFLIIIICEDEGLDIAFALLEAIVADFTQLGDQPVSEVFVSEGGGYGVER